LVGVDSESQRVGFVVVNSEISRLTPAELDLSREFERVSQSRLTKSCDTLATSLQKKHAMKLHGKQVVH